jgi:hypothetical protein
MAQTIEPFVGVVCVGGSLFQDSVCMNHLARDKVFADAEVLERALGLRTPELSAGTSTSPRLSVSFRMLLIAASSAACDRVAESADASCPE